MKIALYKNMKHDFEAVSEFNENWEDDDEYIRISEIMDVDFHLLKDADVVVKQIKSLDEQKKEIQAKAQQQINIIEQRKAELLAIEYQGAA